jgi:outer membrane protein OmpA-like peptidoglycan-associated protein
LKNSKDTVVQITVTNSYGDFTFRHLKADESYKISVLASDNPKLKDQQIYLAKVDGTIVKSFEKRGNTFIYEVLPAELFKLAKEDEEDTELRIGNFGKSKDLELTVIEDVYYAPNSYEINELSIAQLDKIISAMKKNPSLKLAISSHTDANGDDAYNMTLSEKRAKKVMEYILVKGIGAERIKAKGYGETQIKNRCKNGVDCSELEHELNRRTEFKFTK